MADEMVRWSAALEEAEPSFPKPYLNTNGRETYHSEDGFDVFVRPWTKLVLSHASGCMGPSVPENRTQEIILGDRVNFPLSAIFIHAPKVVKTDIPGCHDGTRRFGTIIGDFDEAQKMGLPVHARKASMFGNLKVLAKMKLQGAQVYHPIITRINEAGKTVCDVDATAPLMEKAGIELAMRHREVKLKFGFEREITTSFSAGMLPILVGNHLLPPSRIQLVASYHDGAPPIDQLCRRELYNLHVPVSFNFGSLDPTPEALGHGIPKVAEIIQRRGFMAATINVRPGGIHELHEPDYLAFVERAVNGRLGVPAAV